MDPPAADLTLDAASRRCAAAGLPAVEAIERLAKGQVSSSYRLTLTDGRVAVLKLSRQAGDGAPLRREQSTIAALRDSGVPVPEWGHFDDSSLGVPSLLSAWLPGAHGDDLFAELPAQRAEALLREVGATLRRVHDLPIDESFDADAWRAAEEEEFRSAVTHIADQPWLPRPQLAEIERAWEAGRSSRLAASSPVRLHGDYQLWNLRVDPVSLAVVGVFDWEESRPGPAMADFRDLELNLFIERPRLRRSFLAGYGLDRLADDDWRHLRLLMLSRALSLLAAYRGAAPMVPRSVLRVLLDRLAGPRA